jgi:hypothetical protein
MKRGLLIILVVLFLSGCGAQVRESGFYERDTHFRSLSHLKFSLWGYKHPTVKDAELSQKEGWWGKPIIATK